VTKLLKKMLGNGFCRMALQNVLLKVMSFSLSKDHFITEGGIQKGTKPRKKAFEKIERYAHR
jgi:hypothetical protein